MLIYLFIGLFIASLNALIDSYRDRYRVPKFPDHTLKFVVATILWPLTLYAIIKYLYGNI